MLHVSIIQILRQSDLNDLSFSISSKTKYRFSSRLSRTETERTCTLVFLSLSVELSLEWLCIVELNDGDGIGEVQELVEVGVPPVSLLLLLSVVADDGMPTPDNSTSSRPIISS